MFIGPKEIALTSEVEGYVFVEFKDGTKDKFSKLQFDGIVTETAIDHTTLRDRNCLFLEEELYKVLLQHNVNVSEVEYLCQRLPHSVKVNYFKAINKLWGKTEDQQKTLWEIHDFLKEDPVKIPSETFTSN